MLNSITNDEGVSVFVFACGCVSFAFFAVFSFDACAFFDVAS